MHAAPPPNSRLTRYWRRVRQLTLLLLVVWFVTTFFLIFFARELSQLSLFGWPFSFYMAAQGALLIYLLIIAVFAWRMRRMDQAFHNDDRHGE